ncbi:MAG: hypothetical protein KDB14_18245 [Planctomycetales bacterium]|nr:hypothetical protein [Planctomycetales bacterium]
MGLELLLREVERRRDACAAALSSANRQWEAAVQRAETAQQLARERALSRDAWLERSETGNCRVFLAGEWQQRTAEAQAAEQQWQLAAREADSRRRQLDEAEQHWRQVRQEWQALDLLRQRREQQRVDRERTDAARQHHDLIAANAAMSSRQL